MKKLILATLLLSCGLATAERWVVSRDKQIPGGGINYRVCRVVVPSMTTLGTTSGASLVITANSVISNSDIIVLQGGTGIPIYAASALNVAAYHCRMNNVANDADGLHANATNLVTSPGNVISAAVK